MFKMNRMRTSLYICLTALLVFFTQPQMARAADSAADAARAAIAAKVKAGTITSKEASVAYTMIHQSERVNIPALTPNEAAGGLAILSDIAANPANISAADAQLIGERAASALKAYASGNPEGAASLMKSVGAPILYTLEKASSGTAADVIGNLADLANSNDPVAAAKNLGLGLATNAVSQELKAQGVPSGTINIGKNALTYALNGGDMGAYVKNLSPSAAAVVINDLAEMAGSDPEAAGYAADIFNLYAAKNPTEAVAMMGKVMPTLGAALDSVSPGLSDTVFGATVEALMSGKLSNETIKKGVVDLANGLASSGVISPELAGGIGALAGVETPEEAAYAIAQYAITSGIAADILGAEGAAALGVAIGGGNEAIVMAALDTIVASGGGGPIEALLGGGGTLGGAGGAGTTGNLDVSGGIMESPDLPTSTAISPTCDNNIMVAMETRAWLEAEREITQNANLIVKPDSVLEYSCFDQFLNVLAQAAPNMFSANKSIWSGSVALITENDMANALSAVAGEPMQAYLANNFAHTYYGGRGSQDYSLSLPIKAAAYNCGEMARVWQEAKCSNFAVQPEDGFLSFRQIMGDDPRKYPEGSSCTPSVKWEPYIEATYDAPVWRETYDPDIMDSYKNVAAFTSVADCAASRAIKTGITLYESQKSYDDLVCVNPGCYARKINEGTSISTSCAPI